MPSSPFTTAGQQWPPGKPSPSPVVFHATGPHKMTTLTSSLSHCRMLRFSQRVPFSRSDSQAVSRNWLFLIPRHPLLDFLWLLGYHAILKLTASSSCFPTGIGLLASVWGHPQCLAQTGHTEGARVMLLNKCSQCIFMPRSMVWKTANKWVSKGVCTYGVAPGLNCRACDTRRDSHSLSVLSESLWKIQSS